MNKINDTVWVVAAVIVGATLAIFIIVGVVVAANTPAAFTGSCPDEISKGDVITYITMQRGEVLDCNNPNILVYTGESLQWWNASKLVVEPVTWPDED